MVIWLPRWEGPGAGECERPGGRSGGVEGLHGVSGDEVLAAVVGLEKNVLRVRVRLAPGEDFLDVNEVEGGACGAVDRRAASARAGDPGPHH